MGISADVVQHARAFATESEPDVRRFEESLSNRRAAIEAAFRAARNATLEQVFAASVWRFTPRGGQICNSVLSYCSDADWVLSDLFKLAALSDLPPEDLGRLLVGPALIHFSYRLIDDVIDGHDSYKGLMPTALGRIKSDWGPGADVEAKHGTLLAGVAILTAAGHATTKEGLPDCFETVGGALVEMMNDLGQDEESYRAMVAAKSVSYSRALYGPLIALFGAQRDDLGQFLEQAFFVGQILNDAHDIDDDRDRGQPNLFLIVGERAEEILFAELGRLRALGEALASPLDGYALSRLASLANYLALIGEKVVPKA